MPKPNIHINDLKDYLAGRLDGKSMHAIEKQALDDPFLAEALEGLMEDPEQSIDGLNTLMERLNERASSSQQGAEQTIRRGIRYWWYGVAALFVLGIGIYMMTRFQSDISGSENLTQEIVRGVDQPRPGPGAMGDTGNGQAESSGQRLAIADSNDNGVQPSIRPGDDPDSNDANKPAKKSHRIDPGSAQEQAIATSRMTHPSGNSNAITPDGQPDSQRTRWADRIVKGNQEALPDRMAVNEKLFSKKPFKNPATASSVNPPVAMQRMQRTPDAAIDKDFGDSSLKNEVVVMGYGNGKSAADRSQVVGSVKKTAKKAANGKDKAKTDLRDLARDPDLVMQKSRLRPVIEMQAYTAYVETEVNRLHATEQLDSAKGTVLLRFLIPENGDGKPTHISIEYSDSRQLSRAAKKILEAGPAWEVIPGTQSPYWGWYSIVFN